MHNLDGSLSWVGGQPNPNNSGGDSGGQAQSGGGAADSLATAPSLPGAAPPGVLRKRGRIMFRVRSSYGVTRNYLKLR